jgi:hypothetical protein
MSYLYLNNEAAELITAHGKNADKGDSLVAKLSKIMHYTAFKKAECESSELFDEVKVAVAAAFTKREKTLLAYTSAEAKSLNDLQKADRRLAKQKIGARCGDLYKALKKRQAEPRDTERKSKTLREFIEAEIGKIEDRIAKADNPDIKSVKATADALNALRATL